MSYRGIKLKNKTGEYLLPLSYYRIGDLFLTTNATNPSSFLGGTWELFGPGRTLVCVDTSQTEFNSVKKTGGSKYMQSHYHEMYGSNDTRASTGSSAYQVNSIFKGYTYDIQAQIYRSAFGTYNSGTGNSENLQPFITCYVWIRTA